MLKKIYRLRAVSLKNSKKTPATFFYLKSAKNGQAVSRFAFVVSKKVDKRATTRNLLKRKLRSCIEEIFDKISAGYDFVFYPSEKAIEADRELILEEVKRVLAKERFIT